MGRAVLLLERGLWTTSLVQEAALSLARPTAQPKSAPAPSKATGDKGRGKRGDEGGSPEGKKRRRKECPPNNEEEDTPAQELPESFTVNKTTWSLALEAVIEYCRVGFDVCETEEKFSVIVAGDRVKEVISLQSHEQSLQCLLESCTSLPDPGEGTILEALEQSLVELDEGGDATHPTRIVLVLPDVGLDQKATTCAVRGVEEGEVAGDVDVEELIRRRLEVKEGGPWELNLVRISTDPQRATRVVERRSEWLITRIHHILAVNLVEAFTDLAQRHFDLLSIKVVGIPMTKEKVDKKEYDVVLLFHAGKTHAGVHTAMDSLPLGSPEYRASRELTLRWKTCDKQLLLQRNFLPCKCIHRATPLRPSAQPTWCLMKYLGKGDKPVALVPHGGESHVPPGPWGGITHVIVEHGAREAVKGEKASKASRGDVFLVCLHTNHRLDCPPPPLTGLDAVAGRSCEFSDIALCNHLQPGTSGSERCNTTTIVDPVPHISSSHMERHTRFFPLLDAQMSLFHHVHSEELKRLLITIRTAALAVPLTQDLFDGAVEALTRLYLHVSHNDQSLFPHLFHGNERLDVYQRLWTEIRSLLTACAATSKQHEELATVAERLPQGTPPEQPSRPPMEEESVRALFEHRHVFPSSQHRGHLLDSPPPHHPKHRRRCVDVPLDSLGRPILPIKLGVLTVHSLGSVVWDRPAFHSERYIWPVGFLSTRSYASMKNPDATSKVLYTCEILDGGAHPMFRVTPEDDPEVPYVSITATGAWTPIIKAVNDVRTEETGKRAHTTVSGPEYFGFAHPSIIRLIQNLPNARKCGRFVFQNVLDEQESTESVSVPSTSHLLPVSMGNSLGRRVPSAHPPSSSGGDLSEAIWADMDKLKGGGPGAGDLFERNISRDHEKEPLRRVVAAADQERLRSVPAESLFHMVWSAHKVDVRHKAVVFDGYCDPPA